MHAQQRVATTIFLIVVASLAGVTGGYYYSQSITSQNISSLEAHLQQLQTNNTALALQNSKLQKVIEDSTRLNGTVKLGYVANSPYFEDAIRTLLKQMVEPELNKYVSSLGYNVTFEFLIEVADPEPPNSYLQKVQSLKSQGVDLFVGGGWNTQIEESLSWVNENDMVTITTSASNPSLAAPDQIFRLGTMDRTYHQKLVDVMWAFGVRTCIVVQVVSDSGDRWIQLFRDAWLAKGGRFVEVVKYDISDRDFHKLVERVAQLVSAEVVNGTERWRVGVQTFCAAGDESDIALAAESYPYAYNATWFSMFSLRSMSYPILYRSGLQATHMGWFYVEPAYPNQRYADVEADFLGLYQYSSFSRYADLYDASWVLAKAVLEAQSTNPDTITKVIPGVCESAYGVTGWLKLDDNGDRVHLPSSNIIGFSFDETGKPVEIQAGYIDGETGAITINTP